MSRYDLKHLSEIAMIGLIMSPQTANNPQVIAKLAVDIAEATQKEFDKRYPKEQEKED